MSVNLQQNQNQQADLDEEYSESEIDTDSEESSSGSEEEESGSDSDLSDFDEEGNNFIGLLTGGGKSNKGQKANPSMEIKIPLITSVNPVIGGQNNSLPPIVQQPLSQFPPILTTPVNNVPIPPPLVNQGKNLIFIIPGHLLEINGLRFVDAPQMQAALPAAQAAQSSGKKTVDIQSMINGYRNKYGQNFELVLQIIDPSMLSYVEPDVLDVIMRSGNYNQLSGMKNYQNVLGLNRKIKASMTTNIQGNTPMSINPQQTGINPVYNQYGMTNNIPGLTGYYQGGQITNQTQMSGQYQTSNVPGQMSNQYQVGSIPGHQQMSGQYQTSVHPNQGLMSLPVGQPPIGSLPIGLPIQKGQGKAKSTVPPAQNPLIPGFMTIQQPQQIINNPMNPIPGMPQVLNQQRVENIQSYQQQGLNLPTAASMAGVATNIPYGMVYSQTPRTPGY